MGPGTGDAVRTPAYRWLYLANVLLCLVLFVPFVHLPAFAESAGLGVTAAAGLVGLIGAASIVGRLALGAIADRMGPLLGYQVSFLLIAASYALWWAGDDSWSLAAFAAVLGVGYGGYVALTPVVLAAFFGIERLGGLIGILLTANAVGSAARPARLRPRGRRYRWLRRRDRRPLRPRAGGVRSPAPPQLVRRQTTIGGTRCLRPDRVWHQVTRTSNMRMHSNIGKGNFMEGMSGSNGAQVSSIRQVSLASLVGTALEWYDYFLFGTAAALIFNELFFPAQRPLTGTLLAFATFGVGFGARPIGGLVFGHFGDKIGRKTMLVITLIIMGVATCAHRLDADLRSDRHLGADPAGRAAPRAGLRRRWRVGRRRTHGRRARPGWQARVLRELAADGRPGGARPFDGGLHGFPGPAGGAVFGLGLAHTVPLEHRPYSGWTLHPAAPHGVSGLSGDRGDRRRGKHAHRGGFPQVPQEYPYRDGGTRGGQHALLHLQRLRAHLRNGGARVAGEHGT